MAAAIFVLTLDKSLHVIVFLKLILNPMVNSSNNLASPTNGNELATSTVQFPSQMNSNGVEEGWDLNRVWNIARRRALIIAGISAIAFSYSLRSILNQKPVYQGGFQLLVEPVNTENDLTNITSQAGSRSGRSGLDYDTQISLLKSPDLLSTVVEKAQTTYPSANYGSIVNGLKVRRLRDTKILAVRYEGENSNEVRLVLEELSKVYLNYSLNQRQSYLRQGIQFVKEQIDLLQKNVDELQNKLQKFRREQGFLEPESLADNLTNQINTLRQEQIGVEQELVQARAQLNSLRTETGKMAALSASPGYQQIVNQMRQIDLEIALERTRFKKQNLNIKLLQHKKDNLIPLLEDETRSVLASQTASATARLQTLEKQKQALVEAQVQLNRELQELPVLTRVYSNLQRELQITTTSLNRFLEIRQNLQVEAAQKEIPWQLVQKPAVAGTPPSDILQSLIKAVAMSLAAGFAAAMLVEKLDSTYHSAEDLKLKTKQPVLGAIPFEPQLAVTNNPNLTLTKQRRKKRRSFKRLFVSAKRSVAKLLSKMNFLAMPIDEYENASAFTEAFRVLHSNLLMLRQNNYPISSLVVSSALPGDGKSTVALHWAKTAVAMGQRVLLVDADLRRPQVHIQLNLDNSQGLSELVTQKLDPLDAIQQINPDEEFYVLTAGKLPEDPVSLLSSATTKQLMKQIHQDFELVIYDAPPLLGLADTNLLTDFIDRMVLVVGLGKTDRSSLQKAIDSLQGYQVPMLGLVANGQRENNSLASEYARSPQTSNTSLENEQFV